MFDYQVFDYNLVEPVCIWFQLYGKTQLHNMLQVNNYGINTYLAKTLQFQLTITTFCLKRGQLYSRERKQHKIVNIV